MVIYIREERERERERESWGNPTVITLSTMTTKKKGGNGMRNEKGQQVCVKGKKDRKRDIYIYT